MLIENKAKHVYIVDGLSFLPGVNSVPAPAWDRIKMHPGVEHRMTEGLLHLLSKDDMVGVDGANPHHSMKGFAPTEAKKLIDSTMDVSLLKAWRQDEKRAELKTAINAQLKKIEGEAFVESKH